MRRGREARPSERLLKARSRCTDVRPARTLVHRLWLGLVLAGAALMVVGILPSAGGKGWVMATLAAVLWWVVHSE